MSKMSGSGNGFKGMLWTLLGCWDVDDQGYSYRELHFRIPMFYSCFRIKAFNISTYFLLDHFRKIIMTFN